MRFLLFTALLFSVSIFTEISAQIYLDEDLSDWPVDPVLSDPLGDDGNSNIDFGDFWMSHDQSFLYFRIQIGNEINLQDDNNITLYLDTDDDASTGLAIADIGAEISYEFGERTCTVRVGNSVFEVNHSEVFMVSSPTYTSEEFEIAIARGLNFAGQDLYQGNTIKVVFRDETLSGDDIPDSGSISYSTAVENPNNYPAYNIPQESGSYLRMLSYNVEFDGFFESDKKPRFERILQAIQPSIIGFQEIYDHSSAQTAQLVEEFLPSGAGEEWYHSKEGPDIIAVSRYPIEASYPILGGSSGGVGNGAFLIDLRPTFDTKLLFIVAHTPCCSDNFNRQQEIDAMLAFVRDAKEGVGPLTLAEGTPIVIVGDMNMVGDKQQFETLLSGDIVFTNPHGADFTPDWDGTDLDDAKPNTTGLPMSLTWYDSGTSFSPGRLDYIVYTGASMELRNTYALFTPTLSVADLQALNLQANDVVFAADHLPLVADFEILVETDIIEIPVVSQPILQAWPNPALDTINVRYELEEGGEVTLDILDVQGRSVKKERFFQASGKYVQSLDIANLPSGNYFVWLKTRQGERAIEVVVK